MQVNNDTELYKAPRTDLSQEQGPFRIYTNYPGRNHPDHDDHGCGPLARADEAFLDPGTFVPMHQHRNEEIISWVPDGVMRHNDIEDDELVIDSDHSMVMGAGSSFWHEERTLKDDPPLRMLQMFVRPPSLDLSPEFQYEPLEDPVGNEWRHLVGPEGSDAPLSVRNEVHLYDIHLNENASVELPSLPDWATYFYVFNGAVEANDMHFDETESGLLVKGDGVTVAAQEETLLVAFLTNPDAPITRQGTPANDRTTRTPLRQPLSVEAEFSWSVGGSDED